MYKKIFFVETNRGILRHSTILGLINFNRMIKNKNERDSRKVKTVTKASILHCFSIAKKNHLKITDGVYFYTLIIALL